MSNFNFDAAFETELDKKSSNGTTARSQKVKTKIKFENRLKREAVDEVIDELPEIGESLHIVSNGRFDYFMLIPRCIDLAAQPIVEEFYFSTWTMSHENVVQILNLFDRGVFKKIVAMTGEYFRSRETAVWHILETGMAERGQRLFANKNHSKITLLKMAGGEAITIEGSANFTANPRIEQFIVTNSPELLAFHKDWMDKMTLKK